MLRLHVFSKVAVLFYSGMLVVTIPLAQWRGHIPHWLAWETFPRDLALGVLAGVLIVWLSRLGARIPSYRLLLEDLAGLTRGLSWRDAFVCALFSSVGEELLFRGLLQPELGLIWASLLFGLIHFGQQRHWLWWTAFACVVGLGFGLLAALLGTLVAPVAAHFVVNFLNLRFLSQWQKPAQGKPEHEVGGAEPEPVPSEQGL